VFYGTGGVALVHSLWSVEKEATKRLALITELTDACQVRDKRINELTDARQERDKRIDELTAGRISLDTTVATLRGLFGRKR